MLGKGHQATMMGPDPAGVLTWSDSGDLLIPSFAYPLNNNPLPSFSDEKDSSPVHSSDSPDSTDSLQASATASPTSHLHYNTPAAQAYKKSATWPRDALDSTVGLQGRASSGPLLGRADPGSYGTGYSGGYLEMQEQTKTSLPPLPELSASSLSMLQGMGNFTDPSEGGKPLAGMGSIDSQAWFNLFMNNGFGTKPTAPVVSSSQQIPSSAAMGPTTMPTTAAMSNAPAEMLGMSTSVGTRQIQSTFPDNEVHSTRRAQRAGHAARAVSNGHNPLQEDGSFLKSPRTTGNESHLEELLRSVVGDVTSPHERSGGQLLSPTNAGGGKRGVRRQHSDPDGLAALLGGQHNPSAVRNQSVLDAPAPGLGGPYSLEDLDVDFFGAGGMLDMDMDFGNANDLAFEQQPQSFARDPQVAAAAMHAISAAEPVVAIQGGHLDASSSGGDEGAGENGDPSGNGRRKKGAKTGVTTQGSAKPTTKEEKSQRRLAQNREAARKWRQKKKAYVQELEVARFKLQITEQKLREAEEKSEKCAQMKPKVENAHSCLPPVLHASCVGEDEWREMSASQREFRLRMEEWKLNIQHKHSLLKEAISKGLSDEQLGGCMEAYHKMLLQKMAFVAEARKVDVFQVIDGTWMTPLERQIMWLGHLRPSLLIKICAQNAGELKVDVKRALNELQQQARQTERQIRCRLEELRESLVGDLLSNLQLEKDCEPKAAAEANVSKVCSAFGRFGAFDELIDEADAHVLRVFTKLHKELLTPNQWARGMIAVGDAICKMQQLSRMWMKAVLKKDVKMEEIPIEDAEDKAFAAFLVES